MPFSPETGQPFFPKQVIIQGSWESSAGQSSHTAGVQSILLNYLGSTGILFSNVFVLFYNFERYRKLITVQMILSKKGTTDLPICPRNQLHFITPQGLSVWSLESLLKCFLAPYWFPH